LVSGEFQTSVSFVSAAEVWIQFQPLPWELNVCHLAWLCKAQRWKMILCGIVKISMLYLLIVLSGCNGRAVSTCHHFVLAEASKQSLYLILNISNMSSFCSRKLLLTYNFMIHDNVSLNSRKTEIIEQEFVLWWSCMWCAW
jgi:hypothetical protein